MTPLNIIVLRDPVAIIIILCVYLADMPEFGFAKKNVNKEPFHIDSTLCVEIQQYSLQVPKILRP